MNTEQESRNTMEIIDQIVLRDTTITMVRTPHAVVTFTSTIHGEDTVAWGEELRHFDPQALYPFYIWDAFHFMMENV